WPWGPRPRTRAGTAPRPPSAATPVSRGDLRRARSPAEPYVGMRRCRSTSEYRRVGLCRFDLRDLQLPRRAAGYRHGYDLAALVAHQGLADRGLVGELVVGGIRLGGADDGVLGRLVGLLVLDVDDD